MKDYSKFSSSTWYYYLSIVFALLLLFLLFPNTSVVLGESDDYTENTTIPGENISLEIPLISDNTTETEPPVSDNTTPEVPPVSDNTTPERPIPSDNVTPEILIPQSEKVIYPDNEDQILSFSGRIRIRIPRGAVSVPTKIKISEYTPSSSTGMRMINFFELNAIQVDLRKKSIDSIKNWKSPSSIPRKN
jgi:hypothetical protein